MNKFFWWLDAPLRYICIGLIYVYKYTISAVTPSTCIYQPTCSTYALIAIKRFGTVKGIWLGAKRILRCSPKYEGGLDPVPDNLKGNLKFLV